MIVYGVAEREPSPLPLLHWPLCVSIWTIGDEDGGEGRREERLLLDTTLIEEQVCAGEVLVAANVEGEVCMVQKMGGVPVDAITLLQCVDVGLQKANEIGTVLKRALEQDAENKDRGWARAELRAENER